MNLSKRTVEQIDQEIAALKKKYEECKGTETEIYTRIVGYYRPVRNFNKGQDAQRKARKNFVIKGIES